MNDLDQDGIWKDSNGRISKFQVFGIGDPDDVHKHIRSHKYA